jgi:hypothetical protein
VVDKHKIFSQLKENLNVVATIFLHTNTFVQHSMPKILEELGIFTEKNMGKIQEISSKLIEKLNVVFLLSRLSRGSRLFLLKEPSISLLK